MATAKTNKNFNRAPTTTVALPECPVCLETMTQAIYLCQSGHSLCSNCTSCLVPPNCPICRQPMTQMRNHQLEDVIAKAKVPCPNKDVGCKYTMSSNEVDEHLKECIFREMECPIGVIFGKCSWTGKVFNMMDHFKEKHAAHCNVSTDADVNITNVNVNEDERHVFLVSQAKLLFILTFKIDTLQKMAYWAIQHIGSKKMAHQHIYEIHLSSNQDPRRKVVYIEHCVNDAIKIDEVFRLGKCGILPLNSLVHFIKDKKMTFRFFIKRLPTGPNDKSDNNKKENNKSDNNKPDNNKPNKGGDKNDNNKPKQHKNFGPKGPGAKGPGPKKAN